MSQRNLETIIETINGIVEESRKETEMRWLRFMEKIAECNPAIPPTVEPSNDSVCSRLETRWIEIPPHYRILEVPRSEFNENYERLDENGDVMEPYSGPISPAMIRKKSSGKLFRLARFVPASLADAVYLEEV